MAVDLTPFGFTPTESLVYTALLRLGPSTGYAVARRARVARANAYAALEGLVEEGLARGAIAPDTPTTLVIDEAHVVLAEHAGSDFAGLWSSHPLIARLAGA